MRARDVLVAGAGMAGLTATLGLVRDGHHVTLLERDPFLLDGPEAAVSWPRRGITHFLQPHAFGPRGVRELHDAFPDVYARLLEAGADEVDCARKLPGARIPTDDELRYLAVRRPVIEWALRRAVVREPGVEVRACVVTGLVVADGRVRGLRTEDGVLRGDAVVDAMGRRSPVRGWLAEAGLPVPARERSDCGVIYYSRYYRLRPGAELPDGPWYLSPRGDLGYAAYASFPGDGGTFAGIFAVPPGDHDLRVLRHEAAFTAAVARVPALNSWTTPDLVEPITTVLPMGSLHNTLDRHGAAAPGLFPVGDALVHTDPVMALGLSFSVVHGRAVGAALRATDDDAEAVDAYLAMVGPEAQERFELACGLDEARLRMWTGGPVDLAHADGDYPLFSLVAAGQAATVDPEVFRVFLRRIGMLDRTAVLDEDAAMQQRIERRFAEVAAMPRPAQGPPRDELLAVAGDAVQRSARMTSGLM